MKLIGLLRALLAPTLLIGMGASGISVRAEEPFQAFLTALRQREMFDIAQTYLEQSKTNPLVSDADRERIPFEEGRTLVDEAATIRDLAIRSQRLDAAQKKFELFISAHPRHPLTPEVAVQLGTVLVERGRVALANSKSPRQTANRSKLLTEAQNRFQQAQKVFSDAEATFDAQYHQFPKVIDPKDRPQIAARDQARLNLIQARMYSATVMYDTTKTLDPKSPDYKTTLETAATRYEQIYKDFFAGQPRPLVVGLYARMYQGQCLFDLGNLIDSQTFLEEVLAQSTANQTLRALTTKALPIAQQAWSKAKQYDKSIDGANSWLNDATATEKQSHDGIAIQWQAARAYQDRAATLKEDRPRDADLREAAKLAAQVAHSSGEFQDEARQLVAKLRKTDSAGAPRTFADAMSEGKKAIDEIAAHNASITQAQGNASQVADLERNNRKAIEQASELFQLALSLRNAEVPIDQINEIRYYQAHLDYQQERYYDAAVLSEFVARKYPDTGLARQCARIALAAYLQAYNQQPENNRAAELNHLTSLAEYIAAKWPNQPESVDAWMLLGDLAIRAGEVQRASEFLTKIPETSPLRSEADLKQGQAIWSRYLESLRSSSAPKPAEAQLMLTTAQTMLERGVERLRAAGAEPSYNLLAAELTLAQIYNAGSHYDKALTILDRPQNGPLALVRAKSPLVERGGYEGEALKSALRSYVGALQLDQAQAVMDELEQRYKTEPDGESQLTALFLGLGRELEDQVQHLQSRAQKDELKRVLDGFQLFLDRILSAKNVSTATLNWIGETYYRLGTGLEKEPANGAQAKSYFEKSKSAYEKLLKLAEADDKLRSSAPAIRLRLARACRGAGQFQVAIDQLTDILNQNPNIIECQVEAARTYEYWGRTDPQYYQKAIDGSGEKGRIWGWNGLRRRLQNAEKFRPFFDEARYEVAECSYRLALSKNGDEKIKSLGTVERLIQSFARLDPQLGGTAWREKYDQLLKDVQRAAGHQPEGLRATPASTAGNRRATTGR